MGRKIYTKKESLQNTWKIVGLAVYLCAFLLIGSFSWKNGIIYLAYGVLLGLGIWQTMEALRWRKAHQRCVETQVPQKGWIVDCVSETITHYRGRGLRYKEHLYYLVVEMYLSGLTEPVTIRSDAYTWPVYQSLASADVNVYSSETEAGYTLDGFHYKSHESEQDILPQTLRKTLPEKEIDIEVVAILLVVMVLVILQRFY